MEEIASLTSAWIFDKNGNIKQVKNETDRTKAKEIYQRAREALRYANTNVGTALLKRISCSSCPIQSSTATSSGPSQ